LYETEFTEALGRLLTDGQLRDDFAVNPDGVISSLCKNALVQAKLVNLKIEELEAQAEVLLRKRFEVIKGILPGLVCRLDLKAWPLFRQYARSRWLAAPQDALDFAEYAYAQNSSKIDIREMNRLRFALQPGPTVKLFWITLGETYPAIQILVRSKKLHWRELVLSLRL
jgi:hypothetical protein